MGISAVHEVDLKDFSLFNCDEVKTVNDIVFMVRLGFVVNIHIESNSTSSVNTLGSIMHSFKSIADIISHLSFDYCDAQDRWAACVSLKLKPTAEVAK